MEKSETGNKAVGKHEFTLICREKGNVHGIEKVISSSETTLHLVSSCGGLVITGEKLRILQYNADTGVLDFTGTVNNIKYSAPKQSLFKRMFK